MTYLSQLREEINTCAENKLETRMLSRDMNDQNQAAKPESYSKLTDWNNISVNSNMWMKTILSFLQTILRK